MKIVKFWITFAFGLISIWAIAKTASAADAVSITQDETAIYETVLASWLGESQDHQLVDSRLSARPSVADPDLRECAKGLDFLTGSQTEQDQKSLAGVQFKRKGIELIDGSGWSPMDPSARIRKGDSIDAAVNDGLSHSLISFSQVTFSRDGKDALVQFNMSCGSLCGTGSTMHLQKSQGQWAILKRCRSMVS